MQLLLLLEPQKAPLCPSVTSESVTSEQPIQDPPTQRLHLEFDINGDLDHNFFDLYIARLNILIFCFSAKVTLTWQTLFSVDLEFDLERNFDNDFYLGRYMCPCVYILGLNITLNVTLTRQHWKQWSTLTLSLTLTVTLKITSTRQRLYILSSCFSLRVTLTW